MEVQNHRVEYNAHFRFPCKMNASATSGILENCKCRISIRMEEKGGRNFRKLGFTDINLAEYAGAGQTTQRYVSLKKKQRKKSKLQQSINLLIYRFCNLMISIIVWTTQ